MVIPMKIDMHCHTKEGSLDGKVPIGDYIQLLKEKGIQGMLVTDHNSYNGYRHWKKHMKGKEHEDFVVLKGIEYDTIDAGHILVIMPETVKMYLLEMRGLPVHLLIDIDHHYGGILGPAHPCGEKFMSYARTKRHRKNPQLIKRFDFVEAFNACEPLEANEEAKKLAEENGLACFGGSDAHKEACVGLAYTDIPKNITCESDLIKCVKRKIPMEGEGSFYKGTVKEKIGKINKLLVFSFWFYNKGAGMVRRNKRKTELKKSEEEQRTH